MRVTKIGDSPITKVGHGDYEVEVRGTRYLISRDAEQSGSTGWGVRQVGPFGGWEGVYPTFRAAAASLA